MSMKPVKKYLSIVTFPNGMIDSRQSYTDFAGKVRRYGAGLDQVNRHTQVPPPSTEQVGRMSRSR